MGANPIFGTANIEFPNMRKNRGILLVKVDWVTENP